MDDEVPSDALGVDGSASSDGISDEATSDEATSDEATSNAETSSPDAPSSSRKPRRRNRDATIQLILDTAEGLLDRKGPDGFGLAELGREAGVSFGLIHHYFGGKERLLQAVLRRTLREMGKEIRSLQDEGSFWSAEAPAVRVIFETFRRKPGFSRLLSWGLLTGLLTAKDVAEEFREDRVAIEHLMEGFRSGIPGATRESAAATGALLMASVLGYNLMRPVLEAGFGWDEERDRLLLEQLVRAMTGLTRPGDS